VDTKKIYDENASSWLRLEPSSLSDFTARPKVFDACGDVTNLSILDIGCGEGYCARELKRRGAGKYTGIDLSEEMIKAAKQRDLIDQYGIEYTAMDINNYSSSSTYNLCIAVFLFNYLTVNEMQQVMTKVYEFLSENGTFIFSIPHPFFPFLPKDTKAPFYFDSKNKNYFTHIDDKFEGEIWKQNGEPLHVQCIHKTFSDYFDSLNKAGFTKLPLIEELTVDDTLIKHNPNFFSPLKHMPLHALFKIQK
jgi:toxoflavin synthase